MLMTSGKENTMHEQQPVWCCRGTSVQGFSHLRTGLVNQDAIRWWQSDSKSGVPLVMAVSDGHGSAKSFRSQIGSKYAVDIAIAEIREFFRLDHPHTLADDANIKLASINEFVQRRLPQLLVEQWQEAVRQHRYENPFTDEELSQLETKEGPAAKFAVEAESSTLAYGATLLTVLVTESFILYLQLGDGDILCVNATGKTTHAFVKAEGLIANETTSLCMEKAWQHVQVRLVPSTTSPPVLMLLSTDGYSNSFANDDDFRRIGTDYRAMIFDRGLDFVAEQLEDILQTTSRDGSGDDITLGLIRQVEKKDPEHVEATLDDLQQRVDHQAALQEDYMIKSQEQFSAVESELQHLNDSQTILKQAVRTLQHNLVLTFVVSTLGFTLGSVGIGLHVLGALPSLKPPSQVNLQQSTQTVQLNLASGASQPIPLRAGLKLYKQGEQLNEWSPNSQETAIAEVIQSSSDPLRLILVNLSEEAWQVTQPDGTTQEIQSQQSVPLQKELKIKLGVIEGIIQ
jgi:serine/threonine protein phosphatase PrpC